MQPRIRNIISQTEINKKKTITNKYESIGASCENKSLLILTELIKKN